jgi:hypothetical protein
MIAKAELTGTIGKILPMVENGEETMLGKLTSADGYVSLHHVAIVAWQGRERPCRRLWRRARVALPNISLRGAHR